jgi:hypothetical protein
MSVMLFLGLELLLPKLARVDNPKEPRVIPPRAVSPKADADREPQPSLEPTPEQVRYAGVLEKGTRLGLLCLFVSFPLYIFGIMEPLTPIERVRECWSLQAYEFHTQTRGESGVGWLQMLGSSDYLNFVGIVILASVTAASYLAILPLMLGRGDKIYAVLVMLQVVVLVLAASGLLAAGH